MMAAGLSFTLLDGLAIQNSVENLKNGIQLTYEPTTDKHNCS